MGGGASRPGGDEHGQHGKKAGHHQAALDALESSLGASGVQAVLQTFHALCERSNQRAVSLPVFVSHFALERGALPAWWDCALWDDVVLPSVFAKAGADEGGLEVGAWCRWCGVVLAGKADDRVEWWCELMQEVEGHVEGAGHTLVTLLLLLGLATTAANREDFAQAWKQVSKEDTMAVLRGADTSRDPLDDSPTTRPQFFAFLESTAPRALLPLELFLFSRVLSPSSALPLRLGCVVCPLLPLASSSVGAVEAWALSLCMPPPLHQHHCNVHRGTHSEGVMDVLAHANIPQQPSWHLLFAAASEATSVKRFVEGVDGYAGPTVVVVRTTKGTGLGAFVSQPWVVGKFFGDANCFLFRLAPGFRCMPASTPSGNFAACVTKAGLAGGSKAGISFGGRESSPRLWIHPDLHSGTCSHLCRTYRQGQLHDEQEYEIASIQVWGCGDDSSLERQKHFRANIDTEKERRRKVDRAAVLGEGGWEDSPDRVLLGMAGTGASYSDHVRAEDNK